MLDVGDDFGCTGDTVLSVQHHVVIGNHNLWSYQNIVMDNDGHSIFDENGNRINRPKAIQFGDHVWMGCGCLVLKGSVIPDGTIVAAGSKISGRLTGDNNIVTDKGKVLKSNISWKE